MGDVRTTAQKKTGVVANALAVFQGITGTKALLGLSVSELSGPEQLAVAEAKKT